MQSNRGNLSVASRESFSGNGEKGASPEEFNIEQLHNLAIETASQEAPARAAEYGQGVLGAAQTEYVQPIHGQSIERPANDTSQEKAVGSHLAYLRENNTKAA